MRRFNYGSWGSDPWTQVERLRAEVKRLRDEAAARDREWRECCFVKDRAMADLAMEIARLRADLEATGSAKLTPVKWRWVLPDGYEIKESVVAEGDPETGEQHGERLVWSWRGRGETGDADNWRDALKEAWRHWAETDGEGEVGT